jgi:hypothetical protein
MGPEEIAMPCPESTRSSSLTRIRTILCSHDRPKRHGPAASARRVYRGDGAWNRQRRTCGISWTTTDPNIAKAFAAGLWRTFEDGSVVLRAEVQPEALITQVPSDEDRDRRQGVQILVAPKQ